MNVLEFPNPGDAKGIPRIRLERGSFFADIVLDRHERPEVYYVIVQQHGSAVVLSLDRHSSFDAARSSADRALQKLDRRAA
jgi:transcriptional antiterminator Rof (Rho-off)